MENDAAVSTPALWFDDEWGTERESGIAPWQRALHAEQKAGLIRLTMCNSVIDFASKLRIGAVKPDGSRQGFGLLIIDVMLASEPEPNYASLGFEDERVLNYDAGAQIAELIRSSRYDAERPRWLHDYVSVPMILLSSSPNLRPLVSNRVGHTRMSALRLVPKKLVARSGYDGMDADAEFIDALRDLLAGQ